MVMRIPIERKPVKLRNPIRKDFCDCWGNSIVIVDDDPYCIECSEIPLDRFKQLIQSIDFCTTIYFSGQVDSCKDKILFALKSGLPVILRTDRVLPSYIIDEMRKVPHSGIQVYKEFSGKTVGDFLRKDGVEGFSLIEQMSVAKSWKIFVGLQIQYKPCIHNKLDMYEMIDTVKNYVNHITIEFPILDDDYVHRTCVPRQLLKQYYHPDIPCREWKMKGTYKKEFLSEFLGFLKPRGISLEVLQESVYSGNKSRIKVYSHGLCTYPMGMKTFYYKKEDDVFIQTDGLGDCNCPMCGKNIFM